MGLHTGHGAFFIFSLSLSDCPSPVLSQILMMMMIIIMINNNNNNCLSVTIEGHKWNSIKLGIVWDAFPFPQRKQ